MKRTFMPDIEMNGIRAGILETLLSSCCLEYVIGRPQKHNILEQNTYPYLFRTEKMGRT